MIKKIGLGVLFASLVGLLIFGAVNRTIATTGDGTHSASNRTTQTGELGGNGRGRQSETSSVDRQFSRVSGPGSYGRGGGRNRAYSSETQANDQQSGLEYVPLQAQVSSINGDLLLLTCDDGQEIEIDGRAWRFIQENGFRLQIGDLITAQGFYDTENRLEIATITNQTNSEELIIRDDSGRPMWAGRGG
jgi:hypothetical protein